MRTKLRTIAVAVCAFTAGTLMAASPLFQADVGSLLPAGDYILMEDVTFDPGTYTEAFWLNTNVNFDGGGNSITSTVPGSGFGLRSGYTDHSNSIRNVTVRNCRVGIQLHRTFLGNMSIINCTVEDCAQEGIWVRAETPNLPELCTIIDCTVTGNGYDGIRVSSFKDVFISGCTVVGNSTGIFVGKSAGGTAVNNQDIEIRDNNVTNNNYRGIDVENVVTSSPAVENVIADNIVTDNSNIGIHFRSCENGRVRDNISTDNGGSGLVLTPDNPAVAQGNFFQGNTGYQVDTDDTDVVDNVVVGTGGDVMFVDGGTVVGNRVSGGRLQTVGTVVVDHNTFNSLPDHPAAIYIGQAGASTVTFTNNLFTDFLLSTTPFVVRKANGSTMTYNNNVWWTPPGVGGSCPDGSNPYDQTFPDSWLIASFCADPAENPEFASTDINDDCYLYLSCDTSLNILTGDSAGSYIGAKPICGDVSGVLDGVFEQSSVDTDNDLLVDACDCVACDTIIDDALDAICNGAVPTSLPELQALIETELSNALAGQVTCGTEALCLHLINEQFGL